MPDVWLLALAPRRLGNSKCVTAAFDDMCHALAETATDLVEHGNAPAVFRDVVEKRCDGKIFIASRFEYKTSDSKQV
jgi:hypothetical protein